ncbi:MAG: CPBP family intramembrane metalloprotease [Acidobacteriota bacterium]|nr:CPBP family intramembrane metalloprotease [Acidobacteriota bacterium]
MEYPFYLVPAFREVREQFAGGRLVWLMLASAVAPYLVASLGALWFTWAGAVKLCALAVAMGLWFRVLPRSAATDVGFLALVAAAKLGHFMDPIYQTRYPALQIGALGDAGLYLMAVMALMLGRRIPETGYGFWPSPREWKIGALHFLYYAPLGCGIGLALKAVRFARPGDPFKLALTLLGALFVLTLMEEFLFRGVLQGWMEEWTGNGQAALVLTSALFGAVHLWFRQFPNWKWVIIAGVLGWFCGRARNQAGSIRASMVTHTLVIVAWRAFFAGV